MSNRRKPKPTGRKFPAPRDHRVKVTFIPDVGRTPTVAEMERYGTELRGVTWTDRGVA